MLSWVLSEQRQLEEFFGAQVRKEKRNALIRKKRNAEAERRREDIAFSLFCSRDWSDDSFRVCLEQIVSPSPDLDAETLLRHLQDRYLQTRLADIADVSEGRGGGIADRDHFLARKLWKEISTLLWIRRQNDVKRLAPTWERLEETH